MPLRYAPLRTSLNSIHRIRHLHHRLVLCLHSPVLAKWCKGAFAEVRTHRVDLSDQEDPACVEGLIHYLYRLGYKDPARGALRYHVQMCVLADKYDIPPLKQLAVARFREVAEKEYAGAAFAEAAAEAFEVAGATAEICEVVAGLAVKHRLLAPSNEGGSAFRGVAKGCPELLMAVLGRMQEEADRDVRKEGPELQEEMCYECPDCGWCIDEDSIKRGFAGVLITCPECRHFRHRDGWRKVKVRRGASSRQA